MTTDSLRHALAADLAFDGQQAPHPAHRLHAFGAKFPAQLPALFIKQLSRPGDLILDPFAGSGTTLLEAGLAGRLGLGVDLDPLAALQSHVKTTPLNGDMLTDTLGNIEKVAESWLARPASLAALLDDHFEPVSRAFIRYWFTPQTASELMAIWQAIGAVTGDSGAIAEFFRLAFSAIIITKSGGVTLARDLAHGRPHRSADKAPRPALPEFIKRAKRNIEAIAQLPADLTPADVLPGDARSLADLLPADYADLVVTSPPYPANAIDYMRAHKFALVWMGHPITTLGSLGGRYIGSNRTTGYRPAWLPDDVRAIIDQVGAADRKAGRGLERYYCELQRVIAGVWSILKPGGAAVFVIAPSTIRGLHVANQSYLAQVAQGAGFDLVGIAGRPLNRDKRMMPTRRGGQAGGIEQRTYSDFVVGLVKPESAPRATIPVQLPLFDLVEA